MRLLDLLAAGVVDRFRPYREGWGASPWHWVLGRLGAAVVAGERGDDPDKTARRWHGERALAYSDSTRLGHVVGINEFHVSLVPEARYDSGAGASWPSTPWAPSSRPGWLGQRGAAAGDGVDQCAWRSSISATADAPPAASSE